MCIVSPGRPFRSCLLFVGKAMSLPKRCFTLEYILDLICKYLVRLERSAKDKYSGLYAL
jgi:hypothetical protein